MNIVDGDLHDMFRKDTRFDESTGYVKNFRYRISRYLYDTGLRCLGIQEEARIEDERWTYIISVGLRTAGAPVLSC
jgi:hypothetical protein